MKQTAVLRVTGEICLYFSILYVFEVFANWWMPMAVFVAACFVLGFLIVQCKSAPLRFLLSLLPGLSFLLCELHPLLALPALAWVYYILVMTQGHYAMPLEDYRKTFTVQMVICLFFVGANLANSAISHGHMIAPLSLIYVFLFLFLGVFAMRRMQMGAGMSRNWQLSNAATVVGFPLLAVVGAILLFLLVRFTAPGIRFLLLPIGRFIQWLFHLLFPGADAFVDEILLKETMKPHTSILIDEPPLDTEGVTKELPDFAAGSSLLIERAASIGAYVVMGLILVLVVYLVLKHVRRNQPLEAEEVYYDETEAAAPKGKKRRSKGQTLTGNANRLRRVYQTYLEFVDGQGVTVTRSDTSQEILDRVQKQGESPEAERLRQLYIAARYGDPKAVTAEQVREAQECLEAILEKNRKDK